VSIDTTENLSICAGPIQYLAIDGSTSEVVNRPGSQEQ